MILAYCVCIQCDKATEFKFKYNFKGKIAENKGGTDIISD